MAAVDRLNRSSRALVWVDCIQYRIDLTSPIGGIPDWLMWRFDECTYCDLQTYALASDLEDLVPEFSLITFNRADKERPQEYGLVVLTAVSGRSIRLQLSHSPYIEPGMRLVTGLSREHCLGRLRQICQENKSQPRKRKQR